jgi:plasmid stabilization system protein ParE
MAMQLRFFFHPEADAELIDAASYYGERSLVVGIEFLQMIDAAIARITEMPRAAPTWPGRPNVRRRVVAKFPYAIIYVVEPAAVRIIAIEHAKRRPGSWTHRL